MTAAPSSGKQQVVSPAANSSDLAVCIRFNTLSLRPNAAALQGSRLALRRAVDLDVFLEGKKKDCYYFLLFLDFAKLR